MKYTLEQLKKRSSVFVDTGSSLLGGCDFHGFPRHRFTRSRYPVISRPLYVMNAGEDEWKNGAFRYRRNSNTFSIELVLEGEFLIESYGQPVAIPAGTLFFVHLHRDSSMMCTTEYAKKFTIVLRGNLLESLIGSLHLNECAALKLREPAKIENLMRHIAGLLQNAEESALHEADVAAYSLLLLLAEEQRERMPEVMQKLLNFILNRLDKMYSIEELALASGLSCSSIHRMFLQYCHCTPLAYMTQCRMTAAEEMLNGGEQSIKEIAAALGYKNQLYFSAVFRKYHGIPPSKFQRVQLDEKA